MCQFILSASLFVMNLAFQAALAKGWVGHVPNWLIVAGFLIPIAPLGWWMWTHEKSQFSKKWICSKLAERPFFVTFVGIISAIILLTGIAGTVMRLYGGNAARVPAVHTADISPPPEGWFTEWGETAPPNAIRSVLDVTTLMPYRSHFNVMLVYFVRDNSISDQENTRIMKSSLFSIHRGEPRMTIDTPIDQKVISESPGSKLGEFRLPMRLALLILPPSVKPRQISKLSDAKRLGGVAVCCNGFGLDLTGKRVPMPKRGGAVPQK